MRQISNISCSVLKTIAESDPGDFGIYKIEDGRLVQLFSSGTLHYLSGMSEEEYERITGDDAAAVIIPQDRPEIARRIGEMLTGGGDQDFTYRIVHKDSGFVWVHARGRILGMYDGAPALMVSYSGTTSEAEKHSVLLDNTSSVIYVIDKSTYELLYANKVALKLWGATDYVGKPCYKFINGKDSPCEWCSVPQLKDGACHADASYSPIQNMWFSVDCRDMDWHGRAATAIYCRDITRQQKHQQRIELDRNNLNTMLGSIPGGVAVFSDRGGSIHLDYTNDGFYKVHHGSKEYWSTRSEDPTEWLIEQDADIFWEEFDRVKSGEKTQGGATYRVLCEDGRIHWINNQFSPAYKDGDVQYYYSSFACLDDQKFAESQRIEARRMYEAAVEEANLVVWEYDIVNHRVTMAENEFTQYDYRKFGLPKIVDNAPYALVPFIDDAYVDRFLKMYEAIEAGAPRVSCDVWYKLKPGTEPRCEHISYTTVFDGDGKPTRAYGIGQNITARKLEEENYERLKRQISGSLANAVASFQLNVSKNMYISGFSIYPHILENLKKDTADEHFRAVAESVIDADIRTELVDTVTCENLIRMFRSGMTELKRDYPVKKAAGGMMWIETTLFLMQNPTSGDIEVLTYAQDITRRKKDEEIIYRFAKDGCDFVGIIERTDSTFELHNGIWDCADLKAGEKTGFETVRKLLIDMYIDADGRQTFRDATSLEAITAALEKNQVYTVTYDLSDTTGAAEKLKKQLRFSWLNDGKNEIIVIQNDITEAYIKEQERISRLSEAVIEAEKASSAKSEFVSRISHDIRTPISIISSMTKFALDDVDDREKLTDDLRKIEASNTFLLSLINDVLDISKIDSGKTELNREPYILADYISNIRNMFEPLCTEKGLSLELEDSRAVDVIVTDKTRLNQITLNLMSNAVKYTKRGGSILFAAKSAKRSDGRVDCEIRVKDSGIGMSSEFQKTMFEPFTQEYSSAMKGEAVSGTGLGLAIVKKIVDLMKGTISVISAPGEGTDFRISFTADEADIDADAAGLTAEASEHEMLSGTVLLAEDNAINTEIAKRILASLGVETVTANNGQEALRRFIDSPPGTFSAILMDIQMPVMNGYEATGKIRGLKREDASTIPIIAMTADAFSAAIEHSKTVGMNEYITKPIDPDKLREVLIKSGIDRR